MKKIIFLFSLFTIHYSLFTALQAQNLVPNPSFEQYTVCPDNYYMLPTDWYTCSGNPDYFNACDTTNGFGVPSNGFGYQQAADRNAYCGFGGICFQSIPYYKEYLGCQLLNPLIIGQKYFISFKVSKAELSQIASNNIGLLFSIQSYQDFQPYGNIWNIPTINFAHVVDTNIITDTVNWTTIKGSIIADSAYRYILIGDFFDSAHTEAMILNHNNFFQQHSYYYIDEVCVSEDSLTCNPSFEAINEISHKEDLINIYPNPANDNITIDVSATLNIPATIEITNIQGQVIKQQTTNTETTNINVSALAKGMYFVRVKTEEGVESRKFIKE